MGAMSFTPNGDGTTTIKTSFCYYIPRHKRMYYQNYEGYPAAYEAAERFVFNPRFNRDIVSHQIIHDVQRQSVDVTIVERRRV